MTFDSLKHLENFKSGIYPAIHTPMLSAIYRLQPAGNILDLACCYGLIGEALLGKGFNVIGVEKNTQYIASAKKYGVQMPIHQLDICVNNLDKLQSIIDTNNIKTVIARRCFPELFSHDLDFGMATVKMFYEQGVESLYLQGRVVSKRTINPLGRIEDEVKICADFYEVAHVLGHISVLRKNHERL